MHERAVGVRVVVLRAPILLRVRATLHGVGVATAEAHVPHAVAAINAAMQPWLTPLSLSLAFLAGSESSTAT